jgi:hypothetical protein
MLVIVEIGVEVEKSEEMKKKEKNWLIFLPIFTNQDVDVNLAFENWINLFQIVFNLKKTKIKNFS